MPGLGNLHIKFFRFNFGVQQLVKIQHGLQLSFCLPIRLATRGFFQVPFLCLVNPFGKCVQGSLLGLHLAIQGCHDAADPVINLLIQLVNHGLNTDDIRIRQGIIVRQADITLFGGVQFAQQIRQRRVRNYGGENFS